MSDNMLRGVGVSSMTRKLLSVAIASKKNLDPGKEELKQS